MTSRSLVAAVVLASMSIGPVRAADFPGTGGKFLADFQKFKFEHEYSPGTLKWTTINADGTRGASQTETIKTQEISDRIFMVSWQEANKSTVVQIQDYGKQRVYTNLTLPDGTFIQLQGSFVPVK